MNDLNLANAPWKLELPRYRHGLAGLLGLCLASWMPACADDDDSGQADDSDSGVVMTTTSEGTSSGGALETSLGSTDAGGTSTGDLTTEGSGGATGTDDAGSSTDEGSESSADDDGGDPLTDEEFAQRLQSVLDLATSGSEVSSAYLKVVTPRGQWAGASGQVAFDDANPAVASDAYVIHSVTKTMTGVLALLAVEDGKLGLDQAIADHLPAELIEGLHVIDEVDRSAELTLRQLLSHRSGLPDYFFDGTTGPDGLPPFLAAMFAEPERRWSPEELIAWTKEHLVARSLPDTTYHYSDTNYVLVGMALEALYERSLQELYAEKIFEPLGMPHTWMLQLDDPKIPADAALSSVYLGETDLSRMPAMTADWSGGGLVSTSDDLHVFLKATLDGSVFSDPNSLAALRDYMPDGEGGEYGLGISRFPAPGFSLEGHGGFGGAFMLYIPEFDTFLIGTTNQAETEADLVTGAIFAVFEYLGISR